MAQAQGDEVKFNSIFQAPTIERLYGELGDTEFEHFVAYVFRQAGFGAVGVGGQHISGIDVKLYAHSNSHADSEYLGAAQAKRYQVGNLVTAPDVNKLRGGVSRTGGQFGYVVTTSGFNGPALAEFDGMPPVWPVDGVHLVRYINYIRGSYAAFSKGAANNGYTQQHRLTPIRPEALLQADGIKSKLRGRAKVLTVANHIGGVGKTTTALNIAFGLAARDEQVLLIDLDAQAHLTRALAGSFHYGEYTPRRRSA
jgi:Restriction endonuclease/AAA domain